MLLHQRRCIIIGAFAVAGLEGATSPEVVLGLLSLVFWAITLVVTVKYVGIVMNADNRAVSAI